MLNVMNALPVGVRYYTLNVQYRQGVRYAKRTTGKELGEQRYKCGEEPLGEQF